jgi:gliding motility associated protien GldN
MWARRVWRQIDGREKINHPLFLPLQPADGVTSLFGILVEGLLEGRFTAYDDRTGDGDEFLHPLSIEALHAILQRRDTVRVPDPDTGELVAVVVRTDVGSAEVVHYHIKEEWFFDRARSVMEVRIIGLAPVIAVVGEDGEHRGLRTLFWLYYPDLRYALANAPAFNRENDGERRSFDDLFIKRMFNGRMIRWSNVGDRPVGATRTGLDALLESDALRETLFHTGYDLWHH